MGGTFFLNQFKMHGVTLVLAVLCAFVALGYACEPDQVQLLQEHCLNKLKPKWSLDNVTVLKCIPTVLAEGTSHFFKYLRHGIRDHCTCHVLETADGAEQTAAFCV